MLVASLLATLALAAKPAPPKAPETYLSIPEIIRRTDKQPALYKAKPLSELKDVKPDALADALWPQLRAHVPSPRVVNVNGARDVRPSPCDPAALVQLKGAAAAMDAQKFPEAEAAAQAAYKADPQCARALSELGDAVFFQGRWADALKAYDAAIALTPDDAELYAYRGNALVRLNRLPEAKDAYVWSLVLAPGNAFAIKALKAVARPLGIGVTEERFQPKALARKEGESIVVYSDPTQRWWFGWGTCKAFWLGDEAHRKAVTGRAPHEFTTEEELECAVGLASVYGQYRSSGATRDPAMDRLFAIASENMSNEFVIYEIASRVDADVVLRLPPEIRPRLRRYIEQFVVPAR